MTPEHGLPGCLRKIAGQEPVPPRVHIPAMLSETHHEVPRRRHHGCAEANPERNSNKNPIAKRRSIVGGAPFSALLSGVAMLNCSTWAPLFAQPGPPPVAQNSDVAPRRPGFPATATEYAKMVEPDLGVPPRIDLDQSVEIPLYVNGVQTYGNLGRACDNPSVLGKDTVSGSTLQRYEGRTADGKPLPDVVWVSFGRNSSHRHDKVVGSVQMIGYNKKTGATAFFESGDEISPWVTLDEGTLRMRGVMPWIDQPSEFDKAFRPPTPNAPQCVQCHQADPFITSPFINAAKIPGTKQNVVPILDEDSPYYVIGGENWDMRTIHIEGNGCFECHRVGMSTMELFVSTGWDPNKHMPPRDPGSLANDLKELLEAWRTGPARVTGAAWIEGAEWIIPPARGVASQVVGDDYPSKAGFNAPNRKKAK